MYWRLSPHSSRTAALSTFGSERTVKYRMLAAIAVMISASGMILPHGLAQDPAAPAAPVVQSPPVAPKSGAKPIPPKSDQPKAPAKALAESSAGIDAEQERTEAEVAAIRAESQAFVEAFNKGNAKGIAELWTADGEYVDDTGRTFAGRSAIEQEYAQFFKTNKGHKMLLAIDSIKLLSDSAAIEDGQAMLTPTPPGPPAISKYTAVHVKVDGKWRMSSVRDTRLETPSAYRNLEELEWMVGRWAAEEHGSSSRIDCRWIANRSYLQRTYSVTAPSGFTVSSGVQIIGWNPRTGGIQCWTFASDGGHALGTWTRSGASWAIDSQGMLPEGSPTRAVTRLTRLDDDTMAWQSVSRTAAGMAFPDSDEIILKRVPESR
jgi:uncharacterized protein (TIGR02246 family)